jgi:hypothetical protein
MIVKRNDAEIGKIGADRVDHCDVLTDKQMARAMKHQVICARASWSQQTAYSALTASHIAPASVASFVCRLT